MFIKKIALILIIIILLLISISAISYIGFFYFKSDYVQQQLSKVSKSLDNLIKPFWIDKIVLKGTDLSKIKDPPWVEGMIVRYSNNNREFFIKKCIYKNKIVYYSHIYFNTSKNLSGGIGGALYSRTGKFLCSVFNDSPGSGDNNCPSFPEKAEGCIIIANR